jgi:hypothetical protein
LLYQQQSVADWRESSGTKDTCPICGVRQSKSILVRLTNEDDSTHLHVESYSYELQEREDILKIFCQNCTVQFAG